MLFMLVMFYAVVGPAEYRAFKLKITNTKTGIAREVISNLTPEQYVHYNPISWYETVEILDHWMCWQRSDGFKSPCKRPDDGPKTRIPAAEPTKP